MKKIAVLSLLIGLSLLFLPLTAIAIEYQHTLDADKMQFSWSVDEDNIYVEISAKTKSWVGIGFDPEKAMQGADIVIGYVKKGKVKIEDHYGNRKTGHQKDTKLGGTNDVKESSGSEEGGVTTISFTLPLKTEDKWDKPLDPSKSVKIMLAHGKGRDSLKSAHPFRALYEVNLSSGESTKIK